MQWVNGCTFVHLESLADFVDVVHFLDLFRTQAPFLTLFRKPKLYIAMAFKHNASRKNILEEVENLNFWNFFLPRTTIWTLLLDCF